jgi:DinB superfamily
MKSGRPEDGEYAPYAQSDIDCVTGDDAVAALRDQEQVVLNFFGAFTDETANGFTYAPGKWTVKEVLGHLSDDERIFAYRALCVARGESAPLPGFDENEYVAGANFESRSLTDLIAEYRSVRHASITLYESLDDAGSLRRGTVNGYSASARGLAFHVAGHELHHLRTLREKYARK